MESKKVALTIGEIQKVLQDSFTRTIDEVRIEIEEKEKKDLRNQLIKSLEALEREAVSFKPRRDADEMAQHLLSRMKLIGKFLEQYPTLDVELIKKGGWSVWDITTVKVTAKDFGVTSEDEAFGFFIAALGHRVFQKYENLRSPLISFLTGLKTEDPADGGKKK
jgi:hypothetical protein